jgi:hypothetical protein
MPTVAILRAASAHEADRSRETTSRVILFPMQAILSSSVESELRDRTDRGIMRGRRRERITPVRMLHNQS